MNSNRIEEIQKETAHPESVSVYQALLQVWNECEQEYGVKLRWIPVEEKLPEVGQWLLVYARSGRHIAWFNGFLFEDRAEYNIEGITHWMHIPKPPCT